MTDNLIMGHIDIDRETAWHNLLAACVNRGELEELKFKEIFIELRDSPKTIEALETQIKAKIPEKLFKQLEKKIPQQIKAEQLKSHCLEKSAVIQMLEENETEEKYLDLGQAGYYWYYGFKIKGKDAIILSSGNVLMDTRTKINNEWQGKNEIKEIIRYQGSINNIAPIISHDTIKKHIEKPQGIKTTHPKEVYAAIRDIILFYMDFAGEDEIADVLACWIIGTYCYPLFYWYPHILINAPRESGKSKCFYIILQLSFRGYDLGASGGVTPAQLFRTIEGARGTLGLDEYEKSQDVKNDTQQLVNQIFNASVLRDSYVIRCEQINKKWESKKFPIFCPKIVANITGINPTSLSRFIAFKWLKTLSDKGKRKPYRAGDKVKFPPIREQCYELILEHWQTIKEDYDSLDDADLINREEDNWLPLLAIARFIDSSKGEEVNAENQLKKYIKGYKELEIETDDNTSNFFMILLNHFDELDAQRLTSREIASIPEIAELLSTCKSPARWIGKVLSSYKFKKTRTGKDGNKFSLSYENISKITDTYFGTNMISPNNTNDTKQHKQHLITLKSDISDIGVMTGESGDAEKQDEKTLTPEVFVRGLNPDDCYEKELIVDYIGEDGLVYALKIGLFHEVKPNIYRVLQ